MLADTFNEEDLDDVVIEDLADGDVKAPTKETAAVNNAMESFMFRETNNQFTRLLGGASLLPMVLQVQ